MKNLIIALLAVILLQSCKVYSKIPVSFEEAYESQQKVKMLRDPGYQKKIELSKIYLKEDVYYGRYDLFKTVRIEPTQSTFYLQTDKIDPWPTTFIVIAILITVALLIGFGVSGLSY